MGSKVYSWEEAERWTERIINKDKWVDGEEKCSGERNENREKSPLKKTTLKVKSTIRNIVSWK